jgi:hypothetical protein
MTITHRAVVNGNIQLIILSSLDEILFVARGTMMFKAKILAAIFSIFYISGCSNYSKVVEVNSGLQDELMIHSLDKNINQDSFVKSYRILKVELDESAIPKKPVFDKEKTLVLPLLAFTYWDHITSHRLGANQIKNNLEDYIKYSFEEGLNQRGALNNKDSADIDISIKIKRLSGKGTYTKSGYFYFLLLAYGFGYGDYNGPYVGDVLFEIELRQGDKVFKREIVGNSALSLKDFNQDIDTNFNRVTRSLEYAISNAIDNFIDVYPR